ncbi:MAG: hypothetical protein BWK80_27795 [Desulfobacteraceae bacterium IS3]|nr:MAG: hypothetical protein BWK80_27795 [Desulfobacteraceae bacterium IS3]
MSAVKEILSEGGYDSPETLARDWALMLALSKLEKYKAECDFFEHKYKMNFEDFETFLHKEKGKEDFEAEEDIEDWEFALKAFQWWEDKIQEIKNA